MIDLHAWHWIVFGLGLMLSELIVPTFVLIWFGLGALLTALGLALADLGLAAQILIWTLASLGMTFAWFKIFRKGDHKSLIGRASAHIEGEVGLIVDAVEPFRAGRIRFQKPVLGSDLWECRAEQPLPCGARAKVERVEGNSVFVIPVPSPSETKA
jgi:membrane protein implicated in regulation of membrane protease activity